MFNAGQEMTKKLETYVSMEPGPEKVALWEEIQGLMIDVAAELHEISTQRPSAYVVLDQLKVEEAKFQANLPKIPKKLSIWKLFLGFKKPFKY